MSAALRRSAPSPAGGHVPVLLEAVLEHLAPAPGKVVIDATFGAGGYSRALLEAGATVVAIDRDPAASPRALEVARVAGNRFAFVPGRFSELDRHVETAGHAAADAVVLDVGVSSMQLDDAERGFSFRFDGPLDMRMEAAGPSAADLVNRLPGRVLSMVLSRLGEERRASAIARAIVEARSLAPITRTAELAGLVQRVLGPPRPGDIHPATRTFQALRILVNDELGELAAALGAAERVLKPGGRLVVVAFHSLEDRIVKRFLAERSRVAVGSRHAPVSSHAEPSFRLLTRGPVEPSAEEAAANPRARSAKLRAAVRLDAPAQPVSPAQLGVPELDVSLS